MVGQLLSISDQKFLPTVHILCVTENKTHLCVIITVHGGLHNYRGCTPRPWQGGERRRKKAPCARSPQGGKWLSTRGLYLAAQSPV